MKESCRRTRTRSRREQSNHNKDAWSHLSPSVMLVHRSDTQNRRIDSSRFSNHFHTHIKLPPIPHPSQSSTLLVCSTFRRASQSFLDLRCQSNQCRFCPTSALVSRGHELIVHCQNQLDKVRDKDCADMHVATKNLLCLFPFVVRRLKSVGTRTLASVSHCFTVVDLSVNTIILFQRPISFFPNL
eukprot:Selendium_serpulae@DN6424_c0_g1_i11.p1